MIGCYQIGKQSIMIRRIHSENTYFQMRVEQQRAVSEMFCGRYRKYSLHRAVSSSLLGTLFFLGASSTNAQGYGIYDARAMAMGGTSVAIANTSHAQFYNPALLSFHDGLEEKTNDGRVYFPMFSTQFSDALGDLIDIEDSNLEDNLINSVDAYNVNPSTANAETVLGNSRNLLDAIDRVDGQSASIEGFFGVSVAEPSDREGGAFYLGARVIGGGVPDITEADLALLEDYVEALEFVSTGGQQGEVHPELFNADGSLIDPTGNLTSTATGRGAAILEFGVSLSREFNLGETKMALGATPKLMMIRTYEAIQTVDGGGITTQSDDEGFRTFNADIGFAVEVTEKIRVGLAIKDILSKEFSTELGGEVRIERKPRVGIGYVADRLQLGLDLDLDLSEPLASEAAIQEVSFGAEWRAMDSVLFRAGYRHDMENARDDILSAGVGLEFRKLLFDLTYSSGGDGRAAAIQMGYAF